MGFLLTANIQRSDTSADTGQDAIELRRWSTDDNITVHIGDVSIAVKSRDLEEAIGKVADR